MLARSPELVERSYTGATLAAEEEEPSGPGGGAGETAEPPPAPPPPTRPRLRRRPLGYKRADVDDALAARDDELAELRQDVAALWLAFAQHDRILRAIAEGAAPRASAERTQQGHVAATETDAGQAPAAAPLAGEAASIGTQLSELEEVLAAIESATQTLERTYSEELAPTGEATAEGTEGPAGDEPAADNPTGEHAGGSERRTEQRSSPPEPTG